MPRADYRNCRRCHRSAAEAGPLSHTRLCGVCGPIVAAENNVSIHLKDGPGYERRKYGIARAEFGPRVALALKQAGFIGAFPLDDVLDAE